MSVFSLCRQISERQSSVVRSCPETKMYPLGMNDGNTAGAAASASGGVVVTAGPASAAVDCAWLVGARLEHAVVARTETRTRILPLM
jgi:hypothetical protein